MDACAGTAETSSEARMVRKTKTRIALETRVLTLGSDAMRLGLVLVKFRK